MLLLSFDSQLYRLLLSKACAICSCAFQTNDKKMYSNDKNVLETSVNHVGGE